MPHESPIVFYPRLVWENIVKTKGYWSIYRKIRAIKNEVAAAPDRWTYTDLAIEPIRGNEDDLLDLYHETSGGEVALVRKHRDEAIRARIERKSAIDPSGTAPSSALTG